MRTGFTQRGFGAIAAIVVLVFLASLAAAMLRLATSQQIGSAQDVLSARAAQSARAGTEWMLRHAIVLSNCTNASGTTLDMSASTGFWVTVTCSQSTPPYNEGESAVGTAQTVTVYTINAVACNSSTCPASGATAAAPGYIERARQVIATN